MSPSFSWEGKASLTCGAERAPPVASPPPSRAKSLRGGKIMASRGDLRAGEMGLALAGGSPSAPGALWRSLVPRVRPGPPDGEGVTVYAGGGSVGFPPNLGPYRLLSSKGAGGEGALPPSALAWESAKADNPRRRNNRTPCRGASRPCHLDMGVRRPPGPRAVVWLNLCGGPGIPLAPLPPIKN